MVNLYRQEARAHIIRQQQYDKKRYNHHRPDPHYQLGDRVFTKIFVARGKLDPRYSPEIRVIVRAHHPTYTVLNQRTGVENRFHVSDLRPVIDAYAEARDSRY
jgi:hypothetical protein